MSQNSTSHTEHFPHTELAPEQGQMSEEGELGTEYTETVVNCIANIGIIRKPAGPGDPGPPRIITE